MNHRSLVITLAASVVFSMIAIGGTASVQADPPKRLQMSIQRLQDWLGEGPRADGWRRYLMLGELQTHAMWGDAADARALMRVRQRFASNTPGIDHPVIVSVRRALDDQIERLRAADGLSWQQALAMARNGTTEVSPYKLEHARRAVLNELLLLDVWYDQVMARAAGRAMREDMQLYELIDALREIHFYDVAELPEADQRQILSGLLRQISTSAPQISLAATQQPDNLFLEMAEFELEQLRQLVLNATRQFAPRPEQRLEAVYLQTLERLDGELDLLRDPRNRQAAVNIGQYLGQLQQYGLADEVVVTVRREFSRPNVYFTLSESLANRLAGRPVSQSRPVDEMILDNRVQGMAHTQGRVFIDFVDDPYQAHISIQMRGQTTGNSFTQRHHITAYTGSNAELEARRSFFINTGSVTEFAPYGAANLQSHFRGTNSIRLIDRLAERQYNQQRNAADAVGAHIAERNLMDDFTRQSQEAVWDVRRSMNRAQLASRDFRAGLSRFRRDFVVAGTEGTDTPADRRPAATDVLSPFAMPEVAVRTSDTHLFGVGRIAASNQIAAPSSPPRMTRPAEVSLRVHESLISNFIGPVFSGRTFWNHEFALKAEALLNDLPPGFQVGDEREEPFAITFAPGRPIQVEFQDDLIGVTVAGRQFQRGDQIYRESMLISVRFRIERRPDGIRLVRQGDVEVEFAVPGQKSAREIAFQSFLRDNLNNSLPEDPRDGGIDLPHNLIPIDQLGEFPNARQLEDLQLVDMVSHDGWLSLGWNYVPGSGAPRVSPYRPMAGHGPAPYWNP